MHINVTQRSRHAFWTNCNRYVFFLSLFLHLSPRFFCASTLSLAHDIWCGILPLPHAKPYGFNQPNLPIYFGNLSLTFLVRGGSHVIPIDYVPTSRPPHAFPRDPVFPQSIKAFPGGWKQILTTQGAMSCNVRLELPAAPLSLPPSASSYLPSVKILSPQKTLLTRSLDVFSCSYLRSRRSASRTKSRSFSN